VQLWRRSRHAVPPLLQDDDPRRQDELLLFSSVCGGPEHVPRGESLAMMAQDRVRRSFLSQVLTPFLNQAAAERNMNNNNKQQQLGSTGLIVAHANLLRASSGVICEVENNPTALRILEALRIPTGVPLVLHYQQVHDDSSKCRFRVCDLPEAEECIIDFVDGLGHFADQPPSDLGHVKLPVWPLNTCLSIQEMLFSRDHSSVRVRPKRNTKQNHKQNKKAVAQYSPR
jgi:hypothetical protein